MNTWIFQSNPHKFRVHEYLLDFYHVGFQVVWGIRQEQYLDDVKPKDEVYIWRSNGGANMPRGIIAHGVITDYPSEKYNQSDDYWIRRDEPPARKSVPIRLDELRIRREIDRHVRDTGVIRYVPIVRNPILRNMQILRASQATNFLLSMREADELKLLWQQTRV